MRTAKKTNNFVQFYCECSGFPSKGAKYSKKTGCPFYINTSKTINGYHVSSFDARHNHQLRCNDLLIDSKIEDEIHILYSAGLAPRHISKVLETKNIFLPSNLISGVACKYKFASIDDEFNELLTFMNNNNGICIPFDYNISNELQGTPLRCGIWTQTKDEWENLINFGNVIFFDSTEPHLKNGWLAIPVSVVDRNRHLLPGGLFYAPFETEEVITFFLIACSNLK